MKNVLPKSHLFVMQDKLEVDSGIDVVELNLKTYFLSTLYIVHLLLRPLFSPSLCLRTKDQ